MKTFDNFESQEKFDSPYRMKIKDVPKNIQQQITLNNDSKINGIVPKNFNVQKHLMETQNQNSMIPGWTAKEIVEYRNEIKKSLKPETLAAFKKITESRKKKEKKQLSNTLDQEILSKIQIECRNDDKSKDNQEYKSQSSNETDDYQFLPISPKNNYVNMSKVELDKLAWMKRVDAQADQTRDQPVRFHLDGSVLCSWDSENQDEPMPSPLTTTKTESCLEDALLHHGDEPHRAGYTITELFWLARSAFPAQRSAALTTLIRVLTESRRLSHVHRLSTPSALVALVECGLPFLARWLIDDAHDAVQPLHEALTLLHGIIVVSAATNDNDDNGVINDIDHAELCWPSRAVASVNVHLSTSEAHRNRCQQLELEPSERVVIHDDVAMRADLIECLVTNTGLIDRFDFLLLTRGLLLPVTTCRLVVELLERIARHSIASAAIVARSPAFGRLLADHLLPTGNRHHPHHVSKDISAAQCVVCLVRLVRVLAASRCMANVPLLGVLDGLYPWLGAPSDDNIHAPVAVTLESVQLAMVLWDRDLARGVVASVTSTLIECLESLMTSENLINDSRQAQLAQALLALATAFTNSGAYNLPVSIESFVQRALTASTSRLLFLIDSATDNRSDCILLLASIVHLAVEAVPIIPGGRYETISTLRDTVVLPVIPVVVAMVNRFLGDSLILGREYRQPNMALWSPPELYGDGKLLCNALQLAEYTRNPHHVDFVPRTISLHIGFALLSSVSQALSVLASAGVLTYSPPVKEFMKSPQVLRLVHEVARCPPGKIGGCSPHSGLVQLQLEAISRLVLCLSVDTADMPCDTARDLHRAAVKMLPFLGPRLAGIANLLFDRIIFNSSIIVAMGTESSVVSTSVLESMPRVAQTYRDCFPALTTPLGHGCRDATTVCIDSFLMANCRSDEATKWIDAPFERYQRQQRQPMSDNSSQHELILTERVIECLGFVRLLESVACDCSESGSLGPVSLSLRRLIHLLLARDWTEHFVDRIESRALVDQLIRQYLTRPDLIDLESNFSLDLDSSFLGLYSSLMDQFFYNVDPLLANLVVFPCAMRFPAKFRKTLWKMHFDYIRVINIDLTESVFPVTEYLEPEETDCELLKHYWQALKSEILLEERNPLLYWICVHHINRFVYRRLVTTITGATAVQRGFAHLLSNPDWQEADWVRHIRAYKHIESVSPRFYDDVPASRQQHLEQLRDTAEQSLSGFAQSGGNRRTGKLQ